MPKHKLIIAAVIVALSLGGWATLRNSDAPPAPAGTAGFIATTGDPDDPNAVKGLDSGVYNTSTEGLEIEPSPTPGGGLMMDLQGRFQNAATATVADSDSVVVECLPDTVHGGDR